MDRRYPVVDTERGIVLLIVRFGLKDGCEESEPGHGKRSPGRRVLRREVRDDPGDSRRAVQLAGRAADRVGAVVRTGPRWLIETRGRLIDQLTTRGERFGQLETDRDSSRYARRDFMHNGLARRILVPTIQRGSQAALAYAVSLVEQ